MAEYAVLWEEAQRTGARIFFADEAHFRADAELRGQWVLKGKPAVPRQLYLPVGVNQFCWFTSLAWPRCWAALVR